MDSQIDDTIPLVFTQGWEHLECRGPAERSLHYGVTYCAQCGRMVPSREVATVIEKGYDGIDAKVPTLP